MASSVPEFTQLCELSAANVGGRILFATNEWFAAAKNLLKSDDAVFEPGVFTPFGKLMDGWESARRREKGHDWCIIRLGIPGIIRGLLIDTSHFTGNFAPRVSVQAAADVHEHPDLQSWKSEDGLKASPRDFGVAAELHSEGWDELLPMTPMHAGLPETAKHYFSINNNKRYTHIRLNMFPDGGVARLRVYGDVVRDWSQLKSSELVDLSALGNGGIAIGVSDTHYGHPRNLLRPGRGVNMGDGWETARRMDRPAILRENAEGHLILPGNEWTVIQLGVPGTVDEIEVDTIHFKGNFPESCMIEALSGKIDPEPKVNLTKEQCDQLGRWEILLPRTKAHSRHRFEPQKMARPITHVRFTIFPDGGVSRLRLFGRPQLPAKM